MLRQVTFVYEQCTDCYRLTVFSLLFETFVITRRWHSTRMYAIFNLNTIQPSAIKWLPKYYNLISVRALFLLSKWYIRFQEKRKIMARVSVWLWVQAFSCQAPKRNVLSFHITGKESRCMWVVKLCYVYASWSNNNNRARHQRMIWWMTPKLQERVPLTTHPLRRQREIGKK